jgi:hypothetical protein
LPNKKFKLTAGGSNLRIKFSGGGSLIMAFLATASPGIAVLTSSSTLSGRLAPEQGA